MCGHTFPAMGLLGMLVDQSEISCTSYVFHALKKGMQTTYKLLTNSRIQTGHVTFLPNPRYRRRDSLWRRMVVCSVPGLFCANMAATMNESNICRLCATEFDDGISLFDCNNSSTSLEGIINRYLPIKVSPNFPCLHADQWRHSRGFELNQVARSVFEK